jgi:hypothetical protein
MNYRLLLGAGVVLFCLCTSSSRGSAFSYQGQLRDSGEPATGVYDLQFRLANAVINGNYVGAIVEKPAVGITNGLFRVSLDFGAAVFDGSARWLEIGVRPTGSSQRYATLQPRQPVTSAPYAMHATTAGVASTLTAGAVLTNFYVPGNNIQPGTITAVQIDPATDAAYRAADPALIQALAGYTNSSTLYVDVNGYDEGIRGVPSRPWNNPTNAFRHIQDGDTIVLRGSWTLPATPLSASWNDTRGCMSIEAKSNITILGYGSQIKFVGQGIGMSVSNVTNFRLFGLTLSGDRTPYSHTAGVLCFNGVNSFVEIGSCTLRDCFDQAITVIGNGTYNTDNLWIHDNFFYNIGTTNIPDRPDISHRIDGSCISGFVGGNQWIVNNRADNVVRFWEFENAGSAYDDRVFDNVNVLNNTVTRCLDWGILAVNRHLNNVLIAGNKIYRAADTTSQNTINFVHLQVPGTNFIIRDNIFEGSGIGIYSTPYGDTHNVIIANNILRNPGAISLQSPGTNEITHVQIRDNSFEGCFIPLQIGSVDTIITGNTFENFGTQDWSILVDAITENLGWIAGKARKLTVRRNRVLSTGPGEYPVAYHVYDQTRLPEDVLWEDNEYPEDVILAWEPTIKGKTFSLRHLGRGSPAGIYAASPGSTWRDSEGGGMYLKVSGHDQSGWEAFQTSVGEAGSRTGLATTAAAPLNGAIFKGWMTVTNAGQVYKVPLYQ